VKSAVANKEYIERLQVAIRQLHKCDAEHAGTEPVKEVFRGETVWEGDVEIFTVTGHPRAKRAYAWSVNKNTPQEKLTAVLEIRPVKSALDAVKVSIVAEGNLATKTKSIVIADWDSSRGWASDGGFSHSILFKRLERVCVLRGTELKRLVREIRQHKSATIPLKDNVDSESLMSYLRSFGARLKNTPN
jgi:hypothetical protein